ncbi:MAG: NUDIX hydrolase [Psychrilyobacter sp.]|nr:NUDIX hydrolase [Psychrilyobacter sp.]
MNLSELNFLKIVVKDHPTRDLKLEYIEKQDAIGVMVLDEIGEKTLLVDQYRPGTNSHLLEIPAGIIEDGETAQSTLERELREETGYTIEDVEVIYESDTPLASSPGYTTEKLYLYIVKLKDNNIKPLELKLDETEDLVTKWIDLEELGKIKTDMKSLLAYHMYMNINKK